MKQHKIKILNEFTGYGLAIIGGGALIVLVVIGIMVYLFVDEKQKVGLSIT